MARAFFLCAVWLLCSPAVVAQNSEHPSALPTDPPKEQHPLSTKVPLLRAAIRASDFTASEDMQPRPELASQLTLITGFIQGSPADGRPATEQTDVWLGRTTSAIVFAFVCHDHRPEAIRNHLARRENILKDDYVSVLLDPFQDHRRGILFSVNPSGVQADAAWTENNPPDYSYDQVWDSDAGVTRAGWVAVISIPYRSLRFRAGSQEWGVVLIRSLPRNSERDYWPRIAANVSGTLTQEGTLTGIEGLQRSRNLQVNPYGLAQNEHTLNSLDPRLPARRLCRSPTPYARLHHEHDRARRRHAPRPSGARRVRHPELSNLLVVPA